MPRSRERWIMVPGLHSSFPSLFSLGPWSMGWGHPHSGWGFPCQLNFSGKTFWENTLKTVFSIKVYFFWNCNYTIPMSFSLFQTLPGTLPFSLSILWIRFLLTVVTVNISYLVCIMLVVCFQDWPLVLTNWCVRLLLSVFLSCQ